MNALRVAFVTETYPPEVNGVATTTQQFVEGLRIRGHEVTLIRPRQAADGPVAEAPAAPPPGALRQHLLPGLAIPRYPQLRMGLPAVARLRRLWQAQPPDVVHVATEGPLGWSALRAARQLGLPVTSDFRTNFSAYSAHYGIGWLERPITAYLRGFHNACGCTLVPTEALRQQLAQQGFERLHVVPRGVDTQRFAPAHRSETLRATWGAAPDDLVIGCVGRLAAEKNLGVALQAYEQIRRTQPRARLVLVGDGPQQAALQAACPSAVMAGVQRGHALAAHYASFDLFLFPSQTETFGNATLEALASGLPIVAFHHAAAGQLMRHGHDGLLARVDDANGFVALAVQAAADPALRQRLAAQALHTARPIGWDSVVQGFEARLRQVASGTNVSPAPDAEAMATGQLSRH